MPLNARQRGHWGAAQRLARSLGHSDPESFALALPARGPKRSDYVSVERIVVEVLDLVRSQLVAQHVHVGRTVLELAVFQALLEGQPEPVDEIIASVLALGLHEPGLLIYPLFGFGLLHDRTLSLVRTPPILDFVDNDSGIAVTSGVITADHLFGFLDKAAAGLGVVGKIPRRELIGEVSKTGVMDWLTSNPLLIVRIRSISMGARENQSAYVSAIGHRATLLGLASALAKPRVASRLMSLSTQGRSNQDTLDARHYFVLESPGKADEYLRFDRIQMGPRRAVLIQLSDLHIDIDPAAWSVPTLRNRINALTDAMLDLEDLQAALHGPASVVSRKSNVARKLSTSLHWARRSFASFADPREAVVAMAVAFEALLSDGYSTGVTAKIVDRATVCIRAQRGGARLPGAVTRLYEQRGAIVHKGEGNRPESLGLRDARRAYALCFVEVVKRTMAASPATTLDVQSLFAR